MNVPKKAAGLGVGLLLGIGALSTSVAAQAGHEPVGCASHPGMAVGHYSEPVGCASRPGNGYGDKNHHHTGPPGQCPPVAGAKVKPVGCASHPGQWHPHKKPGHKGTVTTTPTTTVDTQPTNAPNGGSRPGYGYGDKNHTHTGPPGLTASTQSPPTTGDQSGDTPHGHGHHNNGSDHGHGGHGKNQ